MEIIKLLPDEQSDIEDLPGKIYNEKSFLFLYKDIEMYFVANYASDVMKWLEENNYVHQEMSSGMLLYQLSDSVVGIDDKGDIYPGEVGHSAWKWNDVSDCLSKLLIDIQKVSNFFE